MIRTTLQLGYNSKPIRFVIVGAWNTIFAYISLAFFYYLLSDKMHYLVIMAFTSVLNITNAYICHKFFVFKTKGNYIKEYLRYYVIYSVPMAIGFISFPFCIEILKMNFYVTQAILTLITLIISWFGHKNVSFRS